MNDFKPGEFRITDKGMKIWNLPEGSAILDMGCGQGETVEYLNNKYGFKTSGIDFSMGMINKGLERNSTLDIQFGDVGFLDNYKSYTFDGAMLECVLSLADMPDEVLHEAYCVLKKGGKFFISDLYIKEPEEEFLINLKNQVELEKNISHAENECSTECADEHKNRPVEFRTEGKFLLKPLVEQLEGIGFVNILWEDCSVELDNYVAEKIMLEGSLGGVFCEEGLKKTGNYKTGYFMLTCEKPL